MKKQIYTDLFSFYSIRRDRYNIRDIRRKIKGKFESKYPQREWNDLSDYERNKFRLITIRDDLIKFTPPEKKKKVEQKIRDELSLTYRTDDDIYEHNQYINLSTKQFYNPSASDEDNREAFSDFIHYFSERFPDKTPPTFEEWIKCPLTLSDYSKDFMIESDRQQQAQSADNPKTQISVIIENIEKLKDELRVNNEIISCLLIVLKNEHNIDIDIESIRRCMDITENAEYLNEESADPDNPHEREIFDSLRKLEEHNFIKKDGKNTR